MKKIPNLNHTKRTALRHAFLLSVAATSLLTPAALAQTESVETVPTAVDSDTQVQDAVIVTGSRIKRPGIDTMYPASTVDIETLEKGAFSNIADALNEMPGFGTPGASPAGAQETGVVGQNHLNYLGLGSQRTLTLVNGRRFVSSNPPGGGGAGSGLQVDFNVIPMALVERVETIGVGGAPIYGSDAIAGTVNVILRDDYEGFDISTQYGLTEEGDAEEKRLQLLVGGNFAEDRGNATLSIEYTKEEGLLNTDRSLYTTNDPFYAADSLVTGDGVFRIFRNQTIDTFSDGGIISAGPLVRAAYGVGALSDGNIYQFAPNGDLVAFNAGEIAPDGSFVWARGGDGTDLYDVSSQIVSPLERMVISGTTHYDLTDSVTFFGDVQVASTTATELANQDGFQTLTGPGGEYGPLQFSADHPLLNDQARGVLSANGLNQFFVNRYHTDVYDTAWENENFLWRVAGGLRGDFDIGDRNFTWEGSFVHGETDVYSGGTMIIDGRFINALDAVELTQTDLDEVAAAGNSLLTFSGTETANVGDVVCSSSLEAAKGNLVGETGSGLTDNHLPYVTGCVPLNLFGAGAPSQAAVDWVTGPEDSKSTIEQTVFNINVGGTLFELPAGGVAFNVGYETREEKGSYRPSTAAEVALGRHEAVLPTEGSFDTSEIFGEVLFPLVSPGMDLPFMYAAEASVAYRNIDNSITGSADVWTVGGRFSPIADLSFRGNYTESVRAPSIGELFGPTLNTFTLANDPCDYRFVAQGSAARAANCAADIAGYDPNTFTSGIVSAGVLGSSGGNQNLQNEMAEAFTIGAIYEPSSVPGLLLTIDYINIEVQDAITVLELDQVLNACYDSDGSSPACASFTRDAAGEISGYTIGQTNAETFMFESMDYRVGYNFEVAELLRRSSDWGGMNLDFRLHQVLEKETSVTGENPIPEVGSFTSPEYSATFDATWQRDNWRVFWRTLWQPEATIDLTGTRTYEDASGKIIDKAGAYFMNNASVSYTFDEPFSGGPQSAMLQLSVNNVFDSEPDTEELALGYYTLAQQLGRTFMIRATASF
ncbi:TonB-dependent receptor domain-containing protein [uncultured Hyphomonas sp.]|uniref:TonB-dependent receptor domain-containing protein n=1 Tax=uncultured Hyphomonas sp. TaxID=225298 RepID=UPI002AAB3AF3|nr:TonB-dependent receptor [uncultured Hyphomonas sp.]